MVIDEEGKCKAVQGAFTFIGWGTVIAGTAVILGGDSDKFKALLENLASFQMMTEWVDSADVPPPQADHYRLQLNGKYDETSSDRKNFQKTETL